MKYSIVMPLYNQLEYVEWHLALFTRIAESRQDFEVLMMDDGSSDGTHEKLTDEKLDLNFPLIYDQVEDKGFRLVHAKNRGVAKASGEWILILDGDTFIDENTLEAYDNEEKDVDTVYFGRRLPLDSRDMSLGYKQGLLSIARDTEDFRGYLENIPPRSFQHFSGANFLVHAKEFKEVKYGTEDWIGYGYDDYAFAIRWMKSGYDASSGTTTRTMQGMNNCVAYHADDKPKNGSKEADEKIRKLVTEEKSMLENLLP